jgi:hypothetical protein
MTLPSSAERLDAMRTRRVSACSRRSAQKCGGTCSNMLDHLPDSLWVWAGDNDIVAALGSGNVVESVPAGNAVHWYENTAMLPTPVFVQRVVSTATTNARFAVALDVNSDGAWLPPPLPCVRVCAPLPPGLAVS